MTADEAPISTSAQSMEDYNEWVRKLRGAWEQVQEVWEDSESGDEAIEEAESYFYAAVNDAARLTSKDGDAVSHNNGML